MKSLVSKTIYILRETKARFKNPIILWSGGKDSTAMLNLCREAFGEVPFPVVHLDTTKKFPEIYTFQDRLVKAWHLHFFRIKNVPKHPPESTFICCNIRKTQALQLVIDALHADAVIVSIRRDEHGVRNKERVISPRDSDFEWHVFDPERFASTQEVELAGWDLYQSEFDNMHHVRVHPLLHWCEYDVWKYTQARSVPVNPLYFAKHGKRYRSIGCMPCTSYIESEATTIDEILEEIKKDPTGERSGRQQDKEQLMEQLRALGYM